MSRHRVLARGARALTGTALAVALLAATLARPAAAHVGSLGGSLRSVPAPTWLVVVTGGGVVGVSFLVTSLVTDRDAVRAVGDSRVDVRVRDGLRSLVPSLGWVGVAGLVTVVAVAVVGPSAPLRNAAVLLVWVGWWAGYTMSTYLVADTWPLVDPWRTLARAGRRALTGTDRGRRSLPDRVGSWPSVVGLLGLVWLEVVSPLTASPPTLGLVVVGYSVVTVAGGVVYGSAWFDRVDPVARVFVAYGRLAPVQRTDDGIRLCPPGSALVRDPDAMGSDDVAFVVALLWVTTYDGLVSTPPWNALLRALADVGAPVVAVHLVTVVVGFGVLLGAYRLAARLARRTANTYVTGPYVAGWFAPALLPIAAGYHLAHFLGYVVGLAPTLLAVGVAPLSPPASPPALVLPSWFGGLQLAFVVVGHLVAVWVAHARAFELFPGRLQPIRSQYPFVAVMVGYTVTSLWLVAQPFSSPLT